MIYRSIPYRYVPTHMNTHTFMNVYNNILILNVKSLIG